MSEPFDIPTLLDQLTLSEKASLVSGQGFWWTRKIERLGIDSIMLSDGPHGLRKQPGPGDHVGIGASVPATCFPTASALASSWDVDLVRSVGVAIGEEAQALGVAVVLGPGINMKRSPLCGRNFEYLSEDPVLAGRLGVAMVDGIQSQGVGTSLKHFAANNQEHDRLRISADIDERPLRELYLQAFEYVVRTAQPWTVMCSYNRINGVWASQDPWLLTEVLRGEWGFDGLVMSDWGAVEDPVAAVAAGLDLEMPSTAGASAAQIEAAVQAGALDEAVLDTAIARLCGLLARAGAVRPGQRAVAEPSADGPTEAFDADAHHALARAVAADCIVLLDNSRGLLPLTQTQGTIAVIGAFAAEPRYQGAGSSKVNPTRVDDALSALREGVATGVSVTYAAGFGIDDPSADAEALRAEAVSVAADADVAVVFLGLPPSFESEGYDRTHLDLPAEQVALLEAVAAANDRLVVVLANGSVVAVNGWAHHAGALVEAWLGGQASGSAVADVLLGDVNPSGRLAETMPIRLQDTASYLNFPGEDRHVRYGEGLHIGYRHHDAVDGAVSFPFGHGHSYTTFEYTDLRVRALDRLPTADWQGAAAIEVTVTITNTGDRPGKEVVQVYVSRPDSAVVRPERELKGFTKVTLAAAESATVTVVLTERDLAHWSPRAGGWVTEPGAVTVAVGASSRDLRASATVQLEGARPSMPLDRSSTLAEWLDHPVGHEVLMEGMRHSRSGDLTILFEDAEQLRMISSFPLNRLLTMLGARAGDGPGDVIDELLAKTAEQ